MSISKGLRVRIINGPLKGRTGTLTQRHIKWPAWWYIDFDDDTYGLVAESWMEPLPEETEDANT